MTNAVFYHKVGTTYDDVTGRQYHFPAMYESRVRQTVGDWIVYYGPLPNLPSRYYWGVARVTAVEPDPARPDHRFAFLEDYLDFDRMVPYAEEGGYEVKLFRSDGSINPGRSVQAVRLIEKGEFASIASAGLSAADEWPDRVDPVGETPGLGEDAQTPFIYDVPVASIRPIISQLINRPFRDAKFKQNIRRLYDRRCAFTGLRLINGGGRPEVEAAHIVPVERGGNDSVQNGIALSGTVHWMFDRGLLSLQDDFTIIRSRHLNHDVSHLLNRDMRALVPKEAHHRPHSEYLSWHRNNIYKG